MAAFRSLGLKYLAVHGGVEVPSEPPTEPFFGDGLRVGVSAQGDSGIVFSADFPNTPGVLTELLLQRLPTRHRLPKARDYRTMAYVALAGEPVVIACAQGAYAGAIRFVRTATGQETAMATLGTVEVVA